LRSRLVEVPRTVNLDAQLTGRVVRSAGFAVFVRAGRPHRPVRHQQRHGVVVANDLRVLQRVPRVAVGVIHLGGPDPGGVLRPVVDTPADEDLAAREQHGVEVVPRPGQRSRPGCLPGRCVVSEIDTQRRRASA